MVAADRRPSTFLTHASFPNAIVALAAVGGSTNAVVHLLAIAGRLGIDLTLDDFDRDRLGRSGAGRPAARRPVPDGGLPSGRRPARRAAGGTGPARPDRSHGHGRAARRLPGRRTDLGPRGHPAPAGTAGRARWHRRAARQPGARRCGDQARRCLTAPDAAPGPGRRLRLASRTSTPASTTRISTSMPTPSWCCGAAARAAIPACRRWPTCRCRRSCSSRACATWCGSATGG